MADVCVICCRGSDPDLSPPAVSVCLLAKQPCWAPAAEDPSGSGCAQQPGEVAQKWGSGIRGDVGSLKWRPQAEKMALRGEVVQQREENGEKLTHAVRLRLWC
ncbi:hypothetical protein PBY51_015884 [Eleginops maclovinus]|uniref:Uncharacterized protein n=1 Tax=Eleginops maclovinus TaxID=56733 RepID=A0AAN8ALR7_ELEMC|nr:hypothetical protein PBY51_015884 [Eleginops maclovinus]